jgi:hypothetical protein
MVLDFENIAIIVAALITGVISPITLQLMQHYLKLRMEKKKHTLDNNSAIEKDTLITSKLRAVLEKHHCDRVWIAEFHNGGKTYSGKSFQRFSTTYEVAAEGVSAEALHTQNIPTSVFSDFFRQLETLTHIYCKDVNKTSKRKEDPTYHAIHNFFSRRGTFSFLCLQIKDIQGNFVGFLCLDGVIKHLDLTQDDIEALALTSSNLAGYLEE